MGVTSRCQGPRPGPAILDSPTLRLVGRATDRVAGTPTSIPVYRNVTGKIRGNWVRWHGPETENLPQLNTTAIMLRHDYFTNIFANNITTDHGALLIELQEEDREGLALDGSSAREIRADITLYTDVSLGASHFVRLFGVHFPSSGGIILSTTSEKFAGLSAMPQFALSNDTFELARQLLNRSLTETLAKEKAGPVDYLPWSSLPNGPSTMTFPAPKCEYIVYLQQHPVVIKGQIARIPLLQSIEDELRFPIGAPVPSPPLMAMSMTLFSPDCGFVLESKGSPAYSPLDGLYLSGPKQEQYRKHAGRLVVIMAAVLCTQIHLLMRQMKEASTPSTRSRVSFYTIAMMSIGDALFGSFILMQLYDEAPFLLLTTATFLTFFSSLIRVFPFLYFYALPGNVLFIKFSSIFTVGIAAWVWMQTVILAGQDLLGPRFLVPNGWAPPAYDYHPILRDTSASGSSEDIEAAGVLPIGFLRGEAIHTAPSSSGDDNKHGSDNTNTHDKDRKTRRFDCAICMQDIDVPVLTAPSSSTVSDL
ncbi:predicted protein [Histoplasma mississippiense (nom. inval.)]|uniref:predicted protein n=1 Tax=Ajellomyces capsulatus (strain NAm1 / WU24) TaxID=2059318 RepID=UPI000157BE6A|nr:predicted protein [Histoplasma mississippiense (nom. inval.)]EDN06924.1 predicted protein [Histoplasma mississippiense (nom. inval.)]